MSSSPASDGDRTGVRKADDDLGATVTLPEHPTRIVSLVPNLSEVLWWWHLADRVVAVTDWCVAPPAAFTGAQRVRGTKNPDVAAIVALRPDVVVANEEENRELDIRRLRDAGVPVYVTRVRTVVDAADSLARLGAALGQEGAGAGLRQTIVRALDQARPPATPLVTLCPVWREPWMATGRATFAGDLLAHCGFEVVPDDPGGRYPTLTLDDAATFDPEVVLLPDEPYPFGDVDRAAFDGWQARIRGVDGTALSWWGPRTPSAIVDLAGLARSLRSRRRYASGRGVSAARQ